MSEVCDVMCGNDKILVKYKPIVKDEIFLEYYRGIPLACYPTDKSSSGYTFYGIGLDNKWGSFNWYVKRRSDSDDMRVAVASAIQEFHKWVDNRFEVEERKANDVKIMKEICNDITSGKYIIPVSKTVEKKKEMGILERFGFV